MTLLLTFTPAATLPGPWEHHHLINKGLPPEPLTRHNQFCTYWSGTCTVSVMLLEEDTNPPLQMIPMLHICSIFQPRSMDWNISTANRWSPEEKHWWLCRSLDFSSSTNMRLTLLAFSDISWQPLNGLLWNLLHIFMVPSGWTQTGLRWSSDISSSTTSKSKHLWFPDDVSWGLWSEL